jgi:hypothetical protein
VKVWIKEPEWPAEREYQVSMDWTFEEELTVRRLAGLYQRDVWSGILQGSTMEATVALSIVAVMRAEPGRDLEYLLKAKRASRDGIAPNVADDDKAVIVRIEFDKPKEDAELPPAGAAEGAAEKRPSSRRRKS